MGHDPQVKRVHYYHADASALGGRLRRPFEQVVASQAPLSLAPAGGYASADIGAFRLGTIVSFEAAHTQVAGGESETGSYSTMVTSVVEGLNVLNTLTADRVVAQISIDHPREGYIPRVNFIGTQFENVRIGGRPVEVCLDLDLCNQVEGFPNQPLTRDQGFLTRVADQRKSMLDGKGIPDWVTERYQWTKADAQGAKQSVLCSLVREIRSKSECGPIPGQKFGNVFEVPEFGKGFLGELIVDGTAFRLIMIRLELGCGIQANVSIGHGSGNGTTSP